VASDPDPVRLSRRGNSLEERTAHVNSENQDQVLARRGQSFDDLLSELRNVNEQRIQLLNALGDEHLARLVLGSHQADLQWGALLGSTRHAQAHVEIVQRALAEGRPSPRQMKNALRKG
jgi:hypothetical protein